MSQHSLPLTEAQLATLCAIHLFPDALQDELLDRVQQHYQAFTHDGNLSKAERDVQHTGCILYWAMTTPHLEAALAEHGALFGEASAQDVRGLVDQFRTKLARTRAEHAS